MEIRDIILTFWPLIVLQVVLAAFGIVDLLKRKKVMHLSKGIWAVIIIVVNFVGPILYFVLGRGEE